MVIYNLHKARRPSIDRVLNKQPAEKARELLKRLETKRTNNSTQKENDKIEEKKKPLNHKIYRYWILLCKYFQIARVLEKRYLVIPN
jgi:hypothetical protein